MRPTTTYITHRYNPGTDAVISADDAGCIACDPTASYSDEIGFEPCKKKGGVGGLSCAKGYVEESKNQVLASYQPRYKPFIYLYLTIFTSMCTL